jgi:hypothetical protein
MINGYLVCFVAMWNSFLFLVYCTKNMAILAKITYYNGVLFVANNGLAEQFQFGGFCHPVFVQFLHYLYVK